MKGLGPAGRLARAFITSPLTPLLVAASVLLGAGAVALLPREEEPQIVVPVIDVSVRMPGASAHEVEERVSRPMEKLLWEIPGVEYVYSMSSPGQSLVVVRFYVGQKEEDAIVRVNQKLFSHLDRIPPGAEPPLVQPRSIDDVPVLALTLWSQGHDDYLLRRAAAELEAQITRVPDVSEVTIIGGRRRQLRVLLDAARLSSYGLGVDSVVATLERQNQGLRSGHFQQGNREFLVGVDGFLKRRSDLAGLVVGVFRGRPVHLGDVARIVDGPEEARQYVFYALGPAAERGSGLKGVPRGARFPAVTISVAKRKGSNAIDVVRAVLERVEESRQRMLDRDIHISVTRNYGETARQKSNELLFHMLLAVLSVAALIWVVLGRRESGIVAIAIPVTLALTLVVFYQFGYTLNRVTLFALIFSIGILVDDAIVVVENIARHYRLAENRGRRLVEVAVEAVAEVGNPTILATLTVIAAILPMAFVRGLMGPYMRPIPVGATAAMIFSLLVAFTVTPWAAARLIRRSGHAEGESEDWTTRLYRRWMGWLLETRLRQFGFLIVIVGLLGSALSMFLFKGVVVKMLPFDNKSDFQVVIDLPEGTPLEQTLAAASAMARPLSQVPEVRDYQIYVGTASPYNFNGLVRHYFLRRQPQQADIQVNLVGKDRRRAQSHDIARRLRPVIQKIAARYGASVKVAEVPPGPPVLQTLVAEIYGPEYERQMALARRVEALFRKTPGVVDIDSSMEAPQQRYTFHVLRKKAALDGISTASISRALGVALLGRRVGLAHLEQEKEDVPILVRLERAQRDPRHLERLRLQGVDGETVPLSELVEVEEGVRQQTLYRKNLMPVVYVTADLAGREESPVYAILKLSREIAALDLPQGYQIEQYSAHLPLSDTRLSLKWDGEWQITYEVFRDLGIAFAVVLLLIYILVVGWFQSMKTPLVIMAAIPFSLVGIVPAHWAMGAFFTATSMIGFIAGAGIVVRNSIILVDFIELRRRTGFTLREAVIDAGAVRFRPMMLTAAAVIVGASVILFDPIFQGLAISLMAGEVASLLLSRMAVPILYVRANATTSPPKGGQS